MVVLRVMVLLGLIDLLGVLFIRFCMMCLMVGIWVELLIRIILLILLVFSLVLFRVCLIGWCMWCSRLVVSFLNLVCESECFRCMGVWVLGLKVMKGREMFVLLVFDRLILVFLVVLIRCCRVCLFLCRLKLCFFWNLFVS